MDAQSRPVALITGAARGIGRACALALADAGFNLLLNDLEPMERLSEGCIVWPGDIARIDNHRAMVDAAIERWRRLDCLVNNAGVSVMHRGDLLDATPASFDRCVNVNTRAVFFLTQTVARHMLAQGEIGKQHRSIINITSSNAVSAAITRGEYCVSKAASSMTTQLFALRLAEAGIGVYEIRPGIIETVMTLPVKAMYDARIAEGLVPMRRWGFPADVAATVRTMAEGRLPYTVGQAIAVDGGLTTPHY